MASRAFSLLNGERAVVLFFITRLLFSTPFSLLLLEASSLSLLAFVALFVEISFERSNCTSQFSTRPGASSGILLGAVTLPAVMFSKLIQLSRGLSLEEVALADFRYQTLLYWATYVGCLRVLLFIGLVSRHSSSSKFVLVFSFISVILCALVYLLVPAGGSNCGMHLAIAAWMLGHGMAAVKLIQHILRAFPSCASVGEALLVTSGLTTYAGDMLRSTLVKVVQLLTSSEVVVPYNIKRSEISTIIQCYLLGLLLFPLLFKFSARISDCFTSPSSCNARSFNERGRSLIFFTSLIVASTVIIPLWVQFVQDFQVHPLWWYECIPKS